MSPDGRTSSCQSCLSIANKKRRISHGYKIRSDRRAARADNNTVARARDRAYYAKNRERALSLQRKYTYGLEESDYQKMLEAQNRSCAICGRQLPLCVDHNHLTGKVRALLCGRCNRMLGQGGESASLLRAGAKYLEEHSCV